MYVTNRRIPEADFVAIQDQLLAQKRITLHKMDVQEIASIILQKDLTQWFLGLVGFPTEAAAKTKMPARIREVAVGSYLLFGRDAQELRARLTDRAVIVVLAERGPMLFNALVPHVATCLGVDGAQIAGSLRGTTDRLIQSGSILSDCGQLCLSATAAEEFSLSARLAAADWENVVRDVQTIIGTAQPRGTAPRRNASRSVLAISLCPIENFKQD